MCGYVGEMCMLWCGVVWSIGSLCCRVGVSSEVFVCDLVYSVVVYCDQVECFRIHFIEPIHLTNLTHTPNYLLESNHTNSTHRRVSEGVGRVTGTAGAGVQGTPQQCRHERLQSSAGLPFCCHCLLLQGL